MLTDRDAISLVLGYYGQRFTARDTARLVTLLSQMDVLELIKYAYAQAVRNTNAEHQKAFETIKDLEDFWRHESSRAEK